ncbi:MAG TPA: cytochrome c-type biogenesis CcmF C-terminal domain-containing protein [Gaiellaceae bacterium]|nr:cytochrome c-type biogenesis CcmF C-terminal domain-containing protein [Gaiellaceae bacterium]
MPELGRAALVVALGLAVYATVAGAVAARRRRRRLAHSAQNALFAAFGATAVAAAVLAAALVRRDLSFVYVAQHISRDLPLPYALTAFWGGQEGSLLLWLLVLTGLGSAAIATGRRAGEDVVAWAVPVLGGLATFFALLVVAVQSPFATQAAPPEGAGMTPSLQNPYMMAHPPMLYLGYVGLAIPWTFAMGALLARRADERWIIATRRWTLLAWAFLGVGQLLGAKWAYEEVGWGGYYAWDPVENAALMPWLAATAYLHSVMIQEKRGMLRVWNVVLVTLAFGLSLFGTFLTRSGVVNSIHSFAQGPIGAWFVAFIALVVGFSLYLIFTRLPLLRSRTRLESLVSREATFLYNNLLLVAFCLTILWGVLFPIVSEAVRGEQRTIGPGYYNFFLKSFGLPLLLLMGIGPLIAWRRASLRALGRTFLWPLGAALAVGLVLLALGAGSSPLGLIAYTFSAFVLASIVLEFARGTRARRALGAPGWGSAFAQLVANNRRRYGGYIVHAAVVLLVIGVVGSSLFQTVREQSLRPGQTMTAGDYTLAYRTLERRQAANAEEERAVLAVSRGGRDLGTVRAGKNLYPVEQQASNEVAIRSDPLTGEDLFVIADEIDADGTVYFKVFVKPLVNLVWLAGLVFIVGAVVAMWPDSREARRLATRTARPPAPARA